MTTVIAVANQKGGVAKTTTVVSLAGALVQTGHEVLVIDLDAQANLTMALGGNPRMLRASIVDVLSNNAKLAAVIRTTDIPGLNLAPATSELEPAERILGMRDNYELVLRQALNGKTFATGAYYDYILLDCPPSTGPVTLNAVIAADLLIIPTQPEFFSAHALRAMMPVIRQVRQHYNPDLVYRILITMHDRRNRIHCSLREQIRATFGEGLFDTIIDIDTKLRESVVAGLPITHYKPQTRSALQYNALAVELIQHVQETVAKPA